MGFAMRRTLSCRQVPHRRVRLSFRGFSLVELMVVFAILGLLLSLSVPSIGTVLETQRVRSASNRLLSDLHLVRSEAIKHNGRVVICKSTDGVQCNALGQWNQGWVVFHDANNNAQRDAGELLVQQQRGGMPGVRLRGNTPVASYVSYTAAGLPKLVSGAFQAGALTVCPDQPDAGATVRRIIIGAPGRPRVVPGVPMDCA